MKKTLILLSMIMILTVGTHAHGFNTVFEADGMKIEAAYDSETLAVGENEVTFEITGMKGEIMTDMEVNVYYFMPSMPSMNYEATSAFKAGKYLALLKPVMPGEWTADIRVKKTGGTVKNFLVNFKVQ